MSQLDESSRGVTTCARHGTETRLRCSQCETPICPRCSVATPVGQKCPDCAKQPRSARAAGRPRQYAKAVGAGALAAGVGAFALALLITDVRFFTWIASGFLGYFVARAVEWGAEGNRADTFRRIAIGLAVVSVAVAWIIVFRGQRLVPGGLNFVTYLAAAYGAYIRFNR